MDGLQNDYSLHFETRSHRNIRLRRRENSFLKMRCVRIVVRRFRVLVLKNNNAWLGGSLLVEWLVNVWFVCASILIY